MPSNPALAHDNGEVTDVAPLCDMAVGSRVRIISIAHGSGLARRLTELGLPRGAEMTVMGRMGRKGAVIVAAFGTRVVLGPDMAQAISVSAL